MMPAPLPAVTRPTLIDLLRAGAVTLRPLGPMTPRVRGSMIALDRAIRGRPHPALALDRAISPNREIDEFGFLRVRDCVLSRAVISPYVGSEIPDHIRLGLDPQRTYFLYRDATELRRATPSFTQCPIMIVHQVVSADNLPPELVIGATGEARFAGDAVIADIVIWRAEAAQAITTGERDELSCGYVYTADMSPGTYRGRHFDGVMRNLICQHVALVDQGRVPGAVVSDRLPMSLRHQRWRWR